MSDYWGMPSYVDGEPVTWNIIFRPYSQMGSVADAAAAKALVTDSGLTDKHPEWLRGLDYSVLLDRLAEGHYP